MGLRRALSIGFSGGNPKGPEDDDFSRRDAGFGRGVGYHVPCREARSGPEAWTFGADGSGSKEDSRMDGLPAPRRCRVGWTAAGWTAAGLAAAGWFFCSSPVHCYESVEDEHYLRVEVRGLLRHGVVSLGEATTGTEITARGITWELDLAAKDDLSAAAKDCNGKVVLVQGHLEMQRRADMQARWIVRVDKLAGTAR